MVPDSLLNLNGDMMAVVDVETSGRLCGWHEILQIAVVPLNSEFEPCREHKPFYLHFSPDHPSRAEARALKVNGLSIDWLSAHGIAPDRAHDLFGAWVDSLELPFKKRLVPLAHNWAFEKGFLNHWLGTELHDTLWHPHPRDTQLVASFLNDAAAYHGLKIPFGSLSLNSLCKKFGIVNSNEHDALADCLATAKLYRALVRSLGHRK